ncbi:MAG: hypothetical protein HRF49_05615 [bacterium]|jgi:hypothetical protein
MLLGKRQLKLSHSVNLVFVFLLLLVQVVMVQDAPANSTEISGQRYSQFWSNTCCRALYGYGIKSDLSAIYEFLTDVEQYDSTLANPMKRMEPVPTAGASRWDYASADAINSRDYCTDFVGALILLRFCSFSQALDLLRGNHELQSEFDLLWRKYSGPAICLMEDQGSLLEDWPNTVSFLEADSTGVAINILRIEFSETYSSSRDFVQDNPIYRPYHSWFGINVNSLEGEDDGK